MVETEEELLRLLRESSSIRATASTQMNITSSRSHMLVIVTLWDESGVVSKLTMVDLAGSENLKQNYASSVQMKEAKKINLSLFELTNVLRDLNIPNKVVVYRNSKLTMLLKVEKRVLSER